MDKTVGAGKAKSVAHIFRVRSRVLTGFALAIPFVEGLGDRRFSVVAVLAVVALPYNMLMDAPRPAKGRFPRTCRGSTRS